MSKRYEIFGCEEASSGVYKKCLGWFARVLQPLAEPHRAFLRRIIASKHGSSSGMGPWLA